MTDLGLSVLKSMLERDPEKRLKLLDFMNLEYNKLEREPFTKLFEERKQQVEEKVAAKLAAKEEE